MRDTAARNMGTLSGRPVPHGFMSEETASIAIRLQRIRNRLVHDAERVKFTPDLLTTFLDAASNLEDALEIIVAKLRHPLGTDRKHHSRRGTTPKSSSLGSRICPARMRGAAVR